MASEAQQLAEMKALVEGIADQLCETVDNNFDIRVHTDSDNVQAQKLSLLINFLLENVRRNVGQLAELNEKLETKVEERIELLDLVISGTDDGVWIWYFTEHRIEFSEKWYSMLGLSQSEHNPSPRYWTQRVHPRDRARLYTAIRALIEGRQSSLNIEYRVYHASGGYRWMLCRGACTRNSAGQPHLLAGTQTDITELKSIDPKSGLPNEHYLRECIGDAIDDGENFSLILFSIDQVDSSSALDEQSGIGYLQELISKALVTGIDIEAVIARVSTTTFAVFKRLPESSEPAAATVRDVSRLVSMFNEAFCKKTQIRFSLGSMTSCELLLTKVEDAMNAAWSVLRHSKRYGCIQHYDQAYREDVSRRLSIEEKLRKGVKNGCVQPWFQPIYSGRNKQLVGFEALARLVCPEKGKISPAEFVPIAEQKSLMWEVGECILRQSMLLAKVMSGGIITRKPCYVAVNVSAQQLVTGKFADFVLALLDEYRLTPDYLRLELTESVLVDNFDVVRSQLSVLRQAGIKIALDDFGTGYSSLSYIRHLPIDVIKIDRSFITDLDSQDRKAAIVKTILSLAELLKLDVVAEGVETSEELAVLNAIQNLSVQGFLFSPPVNEREALTLVKGLNDTPVNQSVKVMSVGPDN